MKVQQQKQFSPITITLESQDEINKVFALLNHRSLNTAVDLNSEWELLEPFITIDYDVYHSKLVDILKK